MLGVRSYRGFAPLSELANVSKADILDQAKNRLGTQRNLSLQHARKAYQYVSETERAFYPEMIFLKLARKCAVWHLGLYEGSNQGRENHRLAT